MDRSICAVVVTYNRKEYLSKLIDALKTQTRKLDGILVFDNHSTDGTGRYLQERGFTEELSEDVLMHNNNFYYYHSSSNTGGSGGFHSAIALARDLGFDALWCMDDDVCPEENCLEQLEKHLTEETRIVIPSRSDSRYQDKAIVAVDMSNPFLYTIGLRKKIIRDQEIQGDSIEIVDMPFEGPLICSSLIREIGLPNKELFIIFDDSDYAYRASKITKLLYCKHAILHKQIIPTRAKDSRMNWKDYYGYRNQIWFDRAYGENIFVKILRPRLLVMDLYLRAIVRRKWSNIRVLHKAYRDGMANRLGKLVEPGTRGDDF